MTMADVKALANRAGSHYFDRGNSKFFGGDKFFGPYVGSGGIFFAQFNKSGWSIKELTAAHRITTVDYKGPTGTRGETIRKAAQMMARGL